MRITSVLVVSGLAVAAIGGPAAAAQAMPQVNGAHGAERAGGAEQQGPAAGLTKVTACTPSTRAVPTPATRC
ncbi:hypothetical protein EV643_101424 [Kribbella sp. VKM Ac-2527]|uniref:Uncharacterized protein n=1 Tax=Kribbella caucasensis TaxID=2512215 RepID=A0A4R6KR46_9ACTN|nr:hypothetical protein [Kribbella sp. VKM Ac-2527]TDO54634.1 hypothetical protein EV643_101424 [Kribbella sp. VKM Ac-2527]